MAPTSKTFVTVLFLSLALCQITSADPSLKDDSLAEKIVGAIKQITNLSSMLREETETVTLSHEDSLVERIQAAFQNLTEQSNKVANVTSSIDRRNASEMSVEVIKGMFIIIDKVKKFTDQLAATGGASLSGDDAEQVVKSLTKFVDVQQTFLEALIDKHEVQQMEYVFPLIADLLVALNEYVASFKSRLIGLIPTQKSAAETQFKSLLHTLKSAIDTYTNFP